MPHLVASTDVLVSGQSTRYSGIYKLEHQSHDMKEEIFVRKGTKLPSCRQCTGPLKFRLVKKVDYIAEDPDFQ
ncbi:MAG TPA: hypothetical protein VKY85_28165 [Candidatus Angelobacter sp.]|nr:hypothetical protein [Candidatus Angelobacter sp.]